MFIVSFGKISKPETREFIGMGDALRFAEGNGFAVVYNQGNQKSVCWLRGRWFRNLCADKEVADPEKYLTGD